MVLEWWQFIGFTYSLLVHQFYMFNNWNSCREAYQDKDKDSQYLSPNSKYVPNCEMKKYIYFLLVLIYLSSAFSFFQPATISLYPLCISFLTIAILWKLSSFLTYNPDSLFLCGRVTGVLLQVRRKFRKLYYLFPKDYIILYLKFIILLQSY